MKVLRCLSSLLLTVFTFASCVTEDDPTQAWSLPLGSGMPAFEVTLSDGSRVSNRDFDGKVGVIVLFNTSCPDCRAELPIIQEVSILTGSDVKYLCIAREEDTESIARFWTDHALTLPYSPQPDRRVYSLFAESIIPRVMVFSPTAHLTASYSDLPLPTAQTLIEAITTASEQ